MAFGGDMARLLVSPYESDAELARRVNTETRILSSGKFRYSGNLDRSK